jgi:hypothetical protein
LGGLDAYIPHIVIAALNDDAWPLSVLRKTGISGAIYALHLWDVSLVMETLSMWAIETTRVVI